MMKSVSNFNMIVLQKIIIKKETDKMDSNQLYRSAQIKKQKEALLDGQGDISLAAILNGELCQHIFSECREFRDRIYNPLNTVFLFIKQVLSPDKSCKKTVNGVLVEKLITNKNRVSTNTGPYCKARQRLPETAVHELVQVTGKLATEKVPSRWQPYGRELKVFDGSTCKMPDTKENQMAFPQHKNQQKGVGFPIIRFLVVMSLSVGTVIDYAMDAYTGKGTGESSLLRRIFDCINKDDIVLGDRYFPNFFLMADLKMKGADGIFRGQSQRHYDFRSGNKLGKNDHVSIWKKPNKPNWMSNKQYTAYPNQMQVREFKVSGHVYVTTFLDGKKYHKKELSDIYKRRWEIELNLKSIKTIMDMDMLSCKSPDMVKKEIGIHFLAYNFIRIIMAESCVRNNAIPWKISFKGSVQLINSFMPYFLKSGTAKNKLLYNEMLSEIAKNKVGNRPGRVEPRRVKQRPKAFPLLHKPRAIEKERLTRKMKRMILKSSAA